MLTQHCDIKVQCYSRVQNCTVSEAPERESRKKNKKLVSTWRRLFLASCFRYGLESVWMGKVCFTIFNFERKIFDSVMGVFFLFLKLPMTRRILVCRVAFLNNTCAGCHRGLEAGGGGFKLRYWPYFVSLSRYSLTRSYFLTAKFRVSW